MLKKIAVPFHKFAAAPFKARVITGVVFASLLAGGAMALSQSSVSFIPGNDEVAAKVNGAVVSRSAFDNVFAEYKAKNAADTNENRQIILDSIVVSELLAQQAGESGLTERADVKAALEMQQRNLLATAYTQEFLRNHAPDDKALNETYAEWVKSQGTTEYKLRSVIVSSKDRADEISSSLRSGGSIDGYLSESLDKQNKTGELGWVTEGSLSKEVKNAVVAGTKSGNATAAIPSQAGWVVIRIDDSRAWKAPEFATVKTELIPAAQQKILRNHVEALRADAGLKKS